MIIIIVSIKSVGSKTDHGERQGETTPLEAAGSCITRGEDRQKQLYVEKQ